MPQTVESVFNNLQLYTDNRDYSLFKLPAQAVTLAAGIIAEINEPFSAMIQDKDEVTLCIPSDYVDEFSNRLKDAQPYAHKQRLITFEAELEPSLVGFLAHVATALAQAEISVLVYCAFSRDHLFVPSDRHQDAIAAIKQLAEDH